MLASLCGPLSSREVASSVDPQHRKADLARPWVEVNHHHHLLLLLCTLILLGSPFRVPVKDVVDLGKVKCSGPGLGTGVRARVPQTFTVDCSQAGRAPLQVAVLGPTGMECLR